MTMDNGQWSMDNVQLTMDNEQRTRCQLSIDRTLSITFMNEAETRAEYIDPALKATGWGVVEGSRILREYAITLGSIEGHGKRAKADIADYVLVYRNHKLAVIEAKAWDKPLTEGVGQAKSYAGKLQVRYTYSTNGQGIYGIDMEEGTEGEVPKNGSLFFTIF